MNKQRKIVITTTYNEMGIIIDTKVEKVEQPNLQSTCNQLANDTINRASAIEALDSIGSLDTDADREYARGIFNALPPAEPKRGKWILDRSGAYCCSECMEPCATFVLMKPRDKFCKMCGSRNEVTE